MTEAVRSYDYDDYSPEDDSDEELATSYLDSASSLAVQTEPISEPEHSVEDSGPLIVTDWLALLTPRPTADLPDDPPAPQPSPEGMSKHLAPPRMRPTMATRLGSGLRRVVLFALLLVVSGAALAAGAYFMLGTTWLAPAVSSLGPVTGTQAQPGQNPVAPGQQGNPKQVGQPPIPGDSTGKAAGTEFTQLREQGIRELKAGHYANAIDLLDNAAAVNEGDAVTEYQLGLAYLGVPDREHSAQDAEMAFRSAVALQPNWAAPYSLLAESLVRQGQFDSAVEPAKQAAQLDPSRAEAWMTLGRAYQGSGNQAEANKAFAEAARRAPAPPKP